MSEPLGSSESSEAQQRALRHELRTPLNQIIGYSELLQEEAQDRGQEDLVPDLKKIDAAARRLVGIIDQLLGSGRASQATPRPRPEDLARGPEPEEPAAPEPGTLGRLLVVDDDASNRDMLARRLERRGYAVTLASDGPEALERIGGNACPYHLVLLDVVMPGMSGLEVLRSLRERFSVADLPVIMATGLDASEDVVQALHIGANDYVTKPLDFSVVIARVETQLALKKAKDQIQEMAAELEVKNRFIRQTFGRFLSDEVVESLLETPEGLRLGGEKRRVTILMSDLRGFTSLAERVTPEQLVSILNNHLGKMADIVMAHGGTIDEFIGDAVLAVFGAPVSRPDDAERAVACAISMQHAVEEVNAENRRLGLPEIAMGIAVNTGDVVVGNIGSHKRMKYGVVGSHVNLAARIESYTVGGQVLISEHTFREVTPLVSVGGQIVVRAKGFSDLITAYEVKGIGGRHNLHLPEPAVELRALPEPVDVIYSVVEGKNVEEQAHQGRLVKLSSQGAEVSGAPLPELLANLSMRVVDRAGSSLQGDIYAKVVDRSADGSWFAVRFTSVPPHIERFFRGLVGAD